MRAAWRSFKETYGLLPVSLLFKVLILWYVLASLIAIFWDLKYHQVFGQHREEIVRFLYVYPTYAILFLYAGAFSWYFHKRQKL